MTAMNLLLRSLIAIPAFAVLWATPACIAHAARTLAHEAATETSIADTGFLDFKTFLLGPTGDDPALTSERLRLVSPETVLYDRARTSRPDLPSGYPDLSRSVFSKRDTSTMSGDELTVEVNGAPITLSLGLGDAVLRDLRESLRLYGVPALFDPMPGAASARHIGNAANDIIRRIDAMEDALATGALAGEASHASAGAMSISEPSSLSILAFGLLAMAWLRRSSRRDRDRSIGLSPRRT